MAGVIKEEGVAVKLNSSLIDKYWGVEYEDAQCRSMGWVDIDKAKIHSPEFCHNPIDVTYEADFSGKKELSKGILVHIRRTTTTELLTKNN